MPLDPERIERLAEMLRSGPTAQRVVALGVLAEGAGREDVAPLLAHARALAREGSPVEREEASYCLARWEEAPRRPDVRPLSALRSHTELEVTSDVGRRASSPVPAPPWWAWPLPRRAPPAGTPPYRARLAVGIAAALLVILLLKQTM